MHNQVFVQYEPADIAALVVVTASAMDSRVIAKAIDVARFVRDSLVQQMSRAGRRGEAALGASSRAEPTSHNRSHIPIVLLNLSCSTYWANATVFPPLD